MNQKQKLEKPQIIFFISSLIIVALGFILLVPKVSSRIIPQKSESQLNNFLTVSQKNNKINPQSFWEFREFYSPGYFNLSKNGFDDTEIKNILNQIGTHPKMVDLYFLKFQSKKVISLDGLTKAEEISEVISDENLEKNEILLENDNSIIFVNDSNQITIISIFSNSELRTTNGYFDHNNKKDREFVDNRNWINVTKIM